MNLFLQQCSRNRKLTSKSKQECYVNINRTKESSFCLNKIGNKAAHDPSDSLYSSFVAGLSNLANRRHVALTTSLIEYCNYKGINLHRRLRWLPCDHWIHIIDDLLRQCWLKIDDEQRRECLFMEGKLSNSSSWICEPSECRDTWLQ